MNYKKILIAFPPIMWDKIVRLAEQRYMNKSELVREAVRDYIERHKEVQHEKANSTFSWTDNNNNSSYR